MKFGKTNGTAVPWTRSRARTDGKFNTSSSVLNEKIQFLRIFCFSLDKTANAKKEQGMNFLLFRPFSCRVRSYKTPNRAKRCTKGLSLTERSETIFKLKLFVPACCASVPHIRDDLGAKRFWTDPSQNLLPFRAYSVHQQTNDISCTVV